MQLKKYLEKEGLSAAEFAKQLGLTRQSIYHYINQERFPAHSVLKKIMVKTGGKVTANDFL